MILFENLYSTKGVFKKDSRGNWGKIVKNFTVVTDKKDSPLYSGFIPNDDVDCSREDSNVKCMSVLIIDYDNEKGEEPTSWGEVSNKLKDYEHYIHSTYSNMTQKNGYIRERFRLILPLSRPVAPEEWNNVWNGFYDMMDQDLNIDKTCKTKARAYFYPSCPENLLNKSFHHINENDKIDPVFLQEQEKVKVKQDRIFKSGENDFEEVAEAIFYIDNKDYYDWLYIGMALKDEFGDKAYDLFKEWSEHDYPTFDEAECYRTWNAIKGSGITINTFFDKAFKAGWIRQNNDDGDTEYLNAIISNSSQKQQEKLFLNYQAPNLVGDIAHWITNTAFKAQPALSLSAAISAVGVIMGQKFCTETNLRSNMLCLSLAGSGYGKDHPQTAIAQMFEDADLHMYLGEEGATSGTALLRSMEKSKGKRLFQMDEFGRLLKGMNNRGSANYEQEFMTNIMQLFSRAKGVYRGKAFAKEDGVVLREPCLCINGYTVPGRFYESVSSSDALDGFLSRWIVFEGDAAPKVNKRAGRYKVPQSLIDRLKKIDEVSELTTVEFTDESYKLWDEFSDYCEEQRIKENKMQTGFDALWTRGAEHAAKLALVCHNIGTNKIDADVMKWGINFIRDMIKNNIIKLKDNIADNAVEADTKRMLRIIKEFGKEVTRTELARCSTWIGSTEKRNAIINELIESGRVGVRTYKKEGAKKPGQLFYYIS